MPIIWGLLTALLFGTSDFAGGVAAKRERLVVVIAGAHVLGLVASVLFALAIGDAFSLEAIWIGAVAGLVGGVGLGLLYRRLAIGPMHVVAPLTAITSAGVPALWSVATGDSLSRLEVVGLVVAVLAVGLVSMAPGDAEKPADLAAVLESLASGVAFGAMFVIFDQTDPDTAPWPIAGARLATASALGAWLLFARSARLSSRASVPVIAAAGILDTFGNITILYGINTGDLAIVAVLGGLYPIATIALAWAVLKDRPTPLQWVGFLAALVATSLIAAG